MPDIIPPRKKNTLHFLAIEFFVHFQSDQKVKIAPIHIWRNFKVPNYWLNDTNERKNEKNERKKQPIHRNGKKVCVQYVSLFAYRLYLIQGVVVMYLYLHEKHKRVFTCKWLWELCVYVMPSHNFRFHSLILR